MNLFTRLGFVRSRKHVTGRGRAAPTPPVRPRLEHLEDRVVPAVSLLHRFEGMSFNDTTSGGEPPDTNLAAGPGHVVELVNTAIRVTNKGGAVLSTHELAKFFSP